MSRRYVRVKARLLDSDDFRRSPLIDPTALSAALGVAILILLLALVLVLRRVMRLERRVAALTRGEDGESLERILGKHLERVIALGVDVAALERRAGALEAEGRHAVRRVGLVRFNPFEDTGSNQSFALATLDEDGDGVVITSLHARGLTRIYAKAIAGWRPDAALSDEEAQALAIARDQSLGRANLRDRVDQGERRGRGSRPAERAEA